MNRQLLLFGASGFIGQNLSEFLSTDYNLKTSSLRDIGNLFKIQNSDVVINLVGKAHDHNGEATERDYYYANYDLVKEIFAEFIKSEASLLIHVSSIAALEEEGSNSELTETMDCNPVSWYGKSKRKAEEFLLEQTIPEGKKLIILRPPMVHGPGDKGNLRSLYKLISKGVPYPLASFNNQRSFISIDNFNYFIQEIIKGQNKIASGIYHISDDTSISTNSIINIIKKVENKNIPNVNLPKGLVKLIAKVGDVLPIPLNTIRLKKLTSNLVVSNKKIKTALNIIKLPLSAEEGLVKTIQSFKK